MKIPMVKQFALFFLIINLAGCANTRADIVEAAKCVAGFSTKVLDDQRPNALKKTFALDLKDCGALIRDTLKRTHSYIYAEDPKSNFIAIYLSETETTPVGIYLTAIDAARTQVEVSSPSTYAKETVLKRISQSVDNKLHPKIEKGSADVKKESGNK